MTADFGKRLKLLRENAGLSREKLAGLTGVVSMTVFRWENGQRSPRAEELKKLSEVLCVTTDELINGPRAKEWHIDVVYYEKEEDMMRMTADMSAGGTEMFVASVSPERVALTLAGDPDSEDELDDLWAALKPKIMKAMEFRRSVLKV